MKTYAIFFLVMRVALIIQFILIIAKRQTRNSIIYITTEIVFKTALFLFIQWFTFNNDFGINFEDKLIISFGGGLLFYDACFNDVPKLIEQLRKEHPDLLPEWLLGSVEAPIKHIKEFSGNE
jgi:hypothetical protein